MSDFTRLNAIDPDVPPPTPAIGDVWFRRDAHRERAWVCEFYPATESLKARVCIELAGGARTVLALDEFTRDYGFRRRA